MQGHGPGSKLAPILQLEACTVTTSTLLWHQLARPLLFALARMIVTPHLFGIFSIVCYICFLASDDEHNNMS